jgi:hypothetical protein
VRVAPPAVPAGDDRADDATVVLGDDERAPIMADQALEAGAVVGGSVPPRLGSVGGAPSSSEAAMR